ncbi:MAG: hypothetical protein IT381_25055 [Deltaproteobacteria bacterium]|nr:hypothetical protein [Deltaproteobacteria bacterium]
MKNLPISIDGFGILTGRMKEDYVIKLDTRCELFVPFELNWGTYSFRMSFTPADYKNDGPVGLQRENAVRALRALTPKQLRAIDAAILAVPKAKDKSYLLFLEKKRVEVWIPVEPSDKQALAVARALVTVANTFADATPVERLAHAVAEHTDPKVRLHELQELQRLLKNKKVLTDSLKEVLEEACADTNVDVRMLATEILGKDGVPALIKILQTGPEAQVEKVLAELDGSPATVLKMQAVLCERLDRASQSVGTHIAELLAASGDVSALKAIEKERNEKIFNRSYKKALHAAAEKLRKRLQLPEGGAVTLADDTGGALSKTR